MNDKKMSAEELGHYILTECVTVIEPPGSLEIDYGKAGQIITAYTASEDSRITELEAEVGRLREALHDIAKGHVLRDIHDPRDTLTLSQELAKATLKEQA